MFKIIILIIFLLFMYLILRGGKKGVRYSTLTYFTLLSIIFVTGIIYISNKYRIYDGPVLEGGFNSLYHWVSVFSYLYIIPAILLIAYILFKLIPKLSELTWIRVTMYIFWFALLAGLSYVSFFIFILIFYGFAP